jgi:hypothetical protein
MRPCVILHRPGTYIADSYHFGKVEHPRQEKKISVHAPKALIPLLTLQS